MDTRGVFYRSNQRGSFKNLKGGAQWQRSPLKIL